MYHHTEEEGKKKRRKLWNVFWIMLGITLVELVVGYNATSLGWTGHWGLKWGFIILTLAKAAFIVLKFMHLGDETKGMKYTILAPYSLFIGYLIFIILVEGTYCGYPENKTKLNEIFMDQKIRNNTKHGRQYINDQHGMKLSGKTPEPAVEETHSEEGHH
jgi:cytochrome c oxidase subunit IV